MSIQTKHILKNLRTCGYHRVPNYFDQNECQRLITLIDDQMKKYPNRVQRDFKEELGGDFRIFGLENIDETVHKFLFEFVQEGSTAKVDIDGPIVVK